MLFSEHNNLYFSLLLLSFLGLLYNARLAHLHTVGQYLSLFIYVVLGISLWIPTYLACVLSLHPTLSSGCFSFPEQPGSPLCLTVRLWAFLEPNLVWVTWLLSR